MSQKTERDMAGEMTPREIAYTCQVLQELAAVPWAAPLLSRITARGGLVPANASLLFEARFAYDMWRRHLEAQYEYHAGVGDSTVEFRIQSSFEWLIELVTLEETEGVGLATARNTSRGVEVSTLLLSSSNLKSSAGHAPPRSRQKQSEEAEMITAQHKIGEKVFSRDSPTKFPLPATGSIHAILADMRGYMWGHGNTHNYRQIAYGFNGILEREKIEVLFWEGAPISGLFEKRLAHPARAAATMQERIHLLGFVAESEYREGEILGNAYWVANPFLVGPDLMNQLTNEILLQKKMA